jgi:hypothetical protein
MYIACSNKTILRIRMIHNEVLVVLLLSYFLMTIDITWLAAMLSLRECPITGETLLCTKYFYVIFTRQAHRVWLGQNFGRFWSKFDFEMKVDVKYEFCYMCCFNQSWEIWGWILKFRSKIKYEHIFKFFGYLSYTLPILYFALNPIVKKLLSIEIVIFYTFTLLEAYSEKYHRKLSQE